MSSCRFLLLLILSFFFPSCHGVKVCDAFRCRREGTAGTYRPGHRPVKFREAPYIAVLMDGSRKPFCLGVLIKLNKRVSGHSIVVLTTCTCAHLQTDWYVGLGTLANDYQIEKMNKYKLETVQYIGQQCDISNTYDANDYAFMFPATTHLPYNFAYFKSKKLELLQSYLHSLMESHENDCYGFGFGGYEYIGATQGPFEREGKAGNILQIYDYRLITDEECEKYVPNCCGKWKDIGAKKEGVIRSKLHCAIRGKESSLCYGDLGSPIICNGYFMGFLKGHLKCPDLKKNAGPDLFLPLTKNIESFLSRINPGYSNDRVEPESFPDRPEEFFEIEEIFTSEDGNVNNSVGAGAGAGATEDGKTKKEKKNRFDEDYYYGFAAPNISRLSHLAIILTTMAQLILFI